VEELKRDDEVQLKLKRKWQIALRRYVLDNNPSVNYAPYFGLPALELKHWIEVQFKQHMQWSNFGKVWNLTQKVPTQLFDLRNEKDLELCWNFINISIQDIKLDATTATVEMFATKQFFLNLYNTTGFEICKKMVDKLGSVELDSTTIIKPLESYIRVNLEKISNFQGFNSEDFSRLNQGEDIQTILMEKEIIKKYGS